MRNSSDIYALQHCTTTAIKMSLYYVQFLCFKEADAVVITAVAVGVDVNVMQSKPMVCFG